MTNSKNTRLLLLGAFSVLALACGDGKKKKDKKSAAETQRGELLCEKSKDDAVAPAGLICDMLQRSATELSGTGAINFVSPLGGVDKNSGFELKFQLKDKGFVELSVHGVGVSEQGFTMLLTGALTVRFERLGKDLLVSTRVGTDASTKPMKLKDVNADAALALAIDVHNAEKPAHVLVWKSGAQKQGADAALFESGYDGEETKVRGSGKGQFWGLNLEDASVQHVSVHEAFAKH